ncbi:MAG TPA: fused MFS/spermidine synthase [Azoarcus sp.]|nr:fused MFS/spermidine synthase [Azoarcus sp.]
MSFSIDISEERGVRQLYFGSEWVQGAMRVRDPYALELQYTRDMLTGLLLRAEDWPREALVIGLGAASLTKFIYRHCPQTRQTTVEIDPRVFAAARQFFKLPPPDERLSIEIEDGAVFVKQTSTSFDLILVDGYDAEAKTGALDTLEFYAAAREKLSDQGLMSMNLFGDFRGFEANLARIREVFGDRVLALPPSPSGNVIVLAAVGDAIELPVDALHDRAERLRQRTGLDLRSTLVRLEQDHRVQWGSLLL